MSDTPRTDAYVLQFKWASSYEHMVDFARELERENNQLRAHVAAAVAERDKRIAELVRYVSELEDVCDSIQLQKAQHAAKSGGSHE